MDAQRKIVVGKSDSLDVLSLRIPTNTLQRRDDVGLALVGMNDDLNAAIGLLPRNFRLLDNLRRVETDSARRHDKLRWPKAACLDLHRVNPHRVYQIGLYAFRPTLAEIKIVFG